MSNSGFYFILLLHINALSEAWQLRLLIPATWDAKAKGFQV